MKLKDFALQHASIPDLREKYQGQGRDFDTELDRALKEAGKKPRDNWVIVQAAIDLLYLWLKETPATTRAGRFIRFILSIFSK